MYGNNGITIPMAHLCRQQRNGSTYVSPSFNCIAIFAVVFMSLLAFQGDLLGHDALALGNQVAFWTEAIAKLAVPLVTFEPADYSVISAPGALGSTSCWRVVGA